MLNPVNFLEGMQRTPGWIKSMKFDTEDNFETYITRMEKYPVQVSSMHYN